MTALVVDCSVTMAWCFEDENDALADAVLDCLIDGQSDVWVPSLWPLEVANVLTVAERRGRITTAEAFRFVDLLSALPIVVDASSHDRALTSVLATARQLGLSAYDASYVDLAARLGASLATGDGRVRRACEEQGIRLFDGS